MLNSLRFSTPECVIVIRQSFDALPLFWIVTLPVYPKTQLPLTNTVAAKDAAGGGEAGWVAAGLVVGLPDDGTRVVVPGRGEADPEVEDDPDDDDPDRDDPDKEDPDEDDPDEDDPGADDPDPDGDDETDDADEREEDGNKDSAGGEGLDGWTATCGIDGSATAGCFDASAGPTARTATQTTSRTRIATPKVMTIRAELKAREACFAGNDDPPVINLAGEADYLVTPCPWHGGPSPG
jgi:hypothetical protein